MYLEMSRALSADHSLGKNYQIFPCYSQTFILCKYNLVYKIHRNWTQLAYADNMVDSVAGKLWQQG